MRNEWRIVIATAIWLFCARITAQEYGLLPPVDMGKWDIPAGNYSGITPLGEGLYAVVDDKAETAGFFVFLIEQDSLSGQVVRVENKGFRGDISMPKRRDAEGVAYTPNDSLIWISGEADQQILAQHLSGMNADKALQVPDCFSIDSIMPNNGFEALCYDTQNDLFWTTTEKALRDDNMLLRLQSFDKKALQDNSTLLRLQSFDKEGHAQEYYGYELDTPEIVRQGKAYAFGAVALCAADNGKLWVMERELNVPNRRLNATTNLKIFEIDPLNEAQPTVKRLIIGFSTRMRLIRPQFANYEGLCKGIRLANGRQTWLLISDSQGGYGNKLCRLRDFLRVIVEQ